MSYPHLKLHLVQYFKVSRYTLKEPDMQIKLTIIIREGLMGESFSHKKNDKFKTRGKQWLLSTFEI